MDFHARYPAISDLRRAACNRIPHFVWEYLDSATGNERTLQRNRDKLDEVLFRPSVLHGEFTPDMSCTFLGQRFDLPFGIAPVGMSGLIWPGAEQMLAQAGARLNIPYSMSTVATQTPEDVAPHLGEHAWFQMYPPSDTEIRLDMMARAKGAGFTTLIMTVDVPVASRRERQTRGGLTQPPKLTPRLALQAALCPVWLNGIRKTGMPRMKMMDGYAEQVQLDKTMRSSTAHVGYLLRTSPDWEYLRKLRAEWDGALIVKGISRPEDAQALEKEGVDALWVSNHAGRQFDGGPATIETLPAIKRATSLPLIVDSGFETGLDILRGIALGADLIMLGRPWHYALGALGQEGAAHMADILAKDLAANMGQLGTKTLGDVQHTLL
jgi:L-lactate dehydrogenase (cytochrome)